MFKTILLITLIAIAQSSEVAPLDVSGEEGVTQVQEQELMDFMDGLRDGFKLAQDELVQFEELRAEFPEFASQADLNVEMVNNTRNELLEVLHRMEHQVMMHADDLILQIKEEKKRQNMQQNHTHKNASVSEDSYFAQVPRGLRFAEELLPAEGLLPPQAPLPLGELPVAPLPLGELPVPVAQYFKQAPRGLRFAEEVLPAPLPLERLPREELPLRELPLEELPVPVAEYFKKAPRGLRFAEELVPAPLPLDRLPREELGELPVPREELSLERVVPRERVMVFAEDLPLAPRGERPLRQVFQRGQPQGFLGYY